jgi:hypothetical protein
VRSGPPEHGAGTQGNLSSSRQKARDWAEALRWVERGLELYGQNAARPEAVDDLAKRVTAYSKKLATDSKSRTLTSPEVETAEN